MSHIRIFLLLVGMAAAVTGWTTGSAQSQRELGALIYSAKCAGCHGAEGRGDGPESGLLHPRPRNLTSGKFKFRSTESGSLPTDDDLMNTVRNGLHSTSMPAWGKFVTGDSLKAVVEYVKGFSTRFKNEQPKPVRLSPAIATSPASIALGKKEYEKLQCGACHGTDGKGAGAIAANLKDVWDDPIVPTNLDEPWTFRGGATARDVYLRFRTGIDGTPMPSYVGSATDQEMWHLANYVVSMARKPVWEMTADELSAFYADQDKRDKANPVKRGEYLVHSLGCAFCHSPIRDDASTVREMMYAGGQKWDLYPFGDYVTCNLTSDKETGLGNWTDDQIKKYITTGVRRDGTRMIPYPMPWTSYAHLKADDLNALVAYLRTIPPIHNKIPPPQKPNLFSYLWGKFRGLILQEDIPLHAYPGNVGEGGTASADQGKGEGQ